MNLTSEIHAYIESHAQEAEELLIELAQIPAPSHHEEKRAAFCKKWLERQGAKGVYMDEALNVIYPVGNLSGSLTVYMAHSDVVFPDPEPLPLKMDEERIYCPGIGDDTANAVALLMAAKYIAENNLTPKKGGLLLIVNACEEGLGNLKGSKKIVGDFGDRIREFISFDTYPQKITDRAVGSKRYRIEITTEGGHSYAHFGNRNAIACLASFIDDLYGVQVPSLGKTTYNVGLIQGGTSVNTIAQQAEMLYEFRSDERESLAMMEEHLNKILEAHRAKGLEISMTLLGDRPCSGDVPKEAHEALRARTLQAVERSFGITPKFTASSTDCNVALAMGIPAVCTGCILGDKLHTREEYIERSSILPGLKLSFEMILSHF